MTDTVNVPQGMIDAVMKVAIGVDEYGSEVFPGPFVAAELVRAMLAVAPKVEQGPAGMILKAPCQHCQRMTIVPKETLALTHPAPASDELLEALESIRRSTSNVVGDAMDCVARKNAHRLACDAIAKHKGPQS